MCRVRTIFGFVAAVLIYGCAGAVEESYVTNDEKPNYANITEISECYDIESCPELQEWEAQL